MTIQHKIEIEPVLHLVMAAVLGLTLAFYNSHKTQFSTKAYLPNIQAIQNPAPAQILAPIPAIPKPQVTSQISPDGTKQLTLTVTTNNDLSKTYTLVASDHDGSNQQAIYTAADTADIINIPFNTWSPDNKYVFLVCNTSSGTKALVFRADGQPFSDAEPEINAAAIFDTKNTGNIYQETTGWASETLLIINSTKPDGSKGPSYWLEIPSKAIIQLSTQF